MLVGLLTAGSVLSGCSPQKSESPKHPSWLSVETNRDVPGILMQDVTYRSGKLRILGQVCRPADQGRHPVIIWNHGGFAGINDRANPAGSCARMAKMGWVYAESSYRGEDGSRGHIEVCDGEVDDVLAFLDIVRAKPYAQRGRVAMVGLSHGGCITTRAIERGAPVKVAVDIAGPTDWTKTWSFLTSALTRPSTSATNRRMYASVTKTIRGAIGGTPQEYPERYRRRSPMADVARLDSWNGSFLVMHGGSDSIVPIEQSCDLARRLGGFQAFRVDASGTQIRVPPAGCRGIGWKVSSNPAHEFTGQRFLIVYDGVNHFLHGVNSQRMIADFLAFIAAKLPN